VNEATSILRDRFGIKGSIDYHQQQMANAQIIPQLQTVRVRIGHVSELGLWRVRYLAWFQQQRTIIRHDDPRIDLDTYNIYRIPAGAPDFTNYCLAVAAAVSGLVPTGFEWESRDRILVIMTPPVLEQI
jgi:hypothetical protein